MRHLWLLLLVLVGLATTTVMRQAAEAEGLRFAAEAFADRRYASDGTLVPRGRPGALIEEPAEAGAQALGIARDGVVTAEDGRPIALRADTICLHGDHPRAAENARATRHVLEAAGVTVGALQA